MGGDRWEVDGVVVDDRSGGGKVVPRCGKVGGKVDGRWGCMEVILEGVRMSIGWWLEMDGRSEVDRL